MEFMEKMSSGATRELVSRDGVWQLDYYPVWGGKPDVWRLFNSVLGMSFEVRGVDTAMEDFKEGLRAHIEALEAYLHGMETRDDK